MSAIVKTQYYYIFNVFTHHLILVVRKKRSQNDKEKSIAIFQVPTYIQIPTYVCQASIIYHMIVYYIIHVVIIIKWIRESSFIRVIMIIFRIGMIYNYAFLHVNRENYQICKCIWNFNINHTCTCMVCILQCVLLIDRLPPLILEFKS